MISGLPGARWPRVEIVRRVLRALPACAAWREPAGAKAGSPAEARPKTSQEKSVPRVDLILISFKTACCAPHKFPDRALCVSPNVELRAAYDRDARTAGPWSVTQTARPPRSSSTATGSTHTVKQSPSDPDCLMIARINHSASVIL